MQGDGDTNDRMKHYALIGNPLEHSWSQRWFEAKFRREGLTDCSYRLHAMATLDGLRQWVAAEEIDGFNVTIPYKQQIVPLLDALSAEAEAIGAVNCVCVEGNRLVGHNTDAPAFAAELEQLSGVTGPLHGAVVLGTGGAAQAVAYALRTMGIEHVCVSRNPAQHATAAGHHVAGYAEAAALPERYDILVNATPVGMWPSVDACPWNATLTRFRLVYDLVYNPARTLLVQRAQDAGITAVGGIGMLQRQAELSWQLWQRQ